MLGSAIPKRWVVSLALVGLVSLFMASYAAVWAGAASATSDTTVGVTPTTTALPPGSVLTDVQVPTLLNLQAGQVTTLEPLLVDDNGDINPDLPSITYHWSSGACGDLDDSFVQNPEFIAVNSACTGTIGVHAYQAGGPQVPATDALISVNVAAPLPTSTALPQPTDPVVIPEFLLPDSVGSDFGVILPSGGLVVITETVGIGFSNQYLLSIPGGALNNGIARAAAILLADSGDVPAPPPSLTEGSSSGTFEFGSSIVEVQWFEPDGTALDTVTLNRPAELCLPYGQSDIETAAGGPDGLAIWRLAGGTDWVRLNSSVDTFNQQVCGRTLGFSFFALGLDVPAPDADAGATLPATGDYAPGAVVLILAMLAGVALVVTSVFTLRRARRVRQLS